MSRGVVSVPTVSYGERVGEGLGCLKWASPEVASSYSMAGAASSYSGGVP